MWVFLVTNDRQIVDIITKAGEYIGYEVELYHDSARALDVLYQNPWRCDLLIADEDMSDVRGSFIADRLLRLREMADVMLLVSSEEIGTDLATTIKSVRWVVAKPSLFKADKCFLSNFVGPNSI